MNILCRIMRLFSDYETKTLCNWDIKYGQTGRLGWWEDMNSLWTQFIDGEAGVEGVCKNDMRKYIHTHVSWD